MKRGFWILIAWMIFIFANSLQASETKPATSADEWRNPNRGQVRVRNVVKVQLEGVHLQVKDNQISRVQGIKTIPEYGIKVGKVLDKKGQEISGFKGSSVLYYDSKKAKDLVAKQENGNELIIHGKLDLDLRILEVEKVEVVSLANSEKSKEEKPAGN